MLIVIPFFLIMIYVILQRGFKTPVSYSKTVTAGAIQLQCDNPDSYNLGFHFQYAVSSGGISAIQYEYQNYQDKECQIEEGNLQKENLDKSSGRFTIQPEKNKFYYVRVLVTAVLSDDRKVVSKPVVLEVDTRIPKVEISISKPKRMQKGIRYYSSPVKITVTGSGRNYDINQLIKEQPIGGVYLMKKGDTAIGWLTEEGAYGLDFAPFPDKLGQSVIIDNPENIGNIVIDKSQPKLEVVYPSENSYKDSDGKITYFRKTKKGEKQRIRVIVKDKNLDVSSFFLQINQQNAEGVSCIRSERDLQDEISAVFEYELPEGKYETITCQCLDMSGNKRVYQDGEMDFCIDYTKPTGKIKIEGNDTEKDTNSMISGKGSAVAIDVQDNLSGIAGVYLYKSEKDNLSYLEIIDWEKTDVMKTGPDEKVIVYMKLVDKAGNTFYSKTKPLIYDTSKPVITVEDQTIRKNSWYSSDIFLKIKTVDPVAGGVNTGIKKITYELISVQEGLSIVTKSGELKEETDFQISAKENNSNNVILKIVATDYAGNQRDYKKEYQIDCDKPEVKLLYNQKQSKNGIYYQKRRTATIQIRERNLRISDINIVGIPKPAFQKTGKETYEAKVNFDKDGEYSFRIHCRDKAGNASKEITEKFILDRNTPKVHLRYTNEENGSKTSSYFNSERRGEVIIQDENIKKKCLPKYLSISKEKYLPLLWKKVKGSYQADFSIDTDGTYCPTLECEDLAGNKTILSEREFILDQEKPQVKVKGIADGQIRNERFIVPDIQVTDTNLLQQSIKYKLEGASQGVLIREKNRSDFKVDNIEKDDIYWLTIEAEDMAGNRTKKKIEFSVNRNGSTYALSEETKKIQGTSRQEAADIYLREVNVCEVDIKKTEIQIFRDNEKEVLPNERYERKMVIKKNGWKEYIYRIDKSCFQKEGVYHIGICSKDEINHKKNSMFQKEGSQLRFIIDRTKPKGHFLNIKDGDEIYKSEAGVKVALWDNVKVERAIAIINGKKEEVPIDKDNLGIKLEEGVGRQNIKVILYDEAGNTSTEECKNLLVTSNPVIRFRKIIVIFFLVGSISIYFTYNLKNGTMKK